MKEHTSPLRRKKINTLFLIILVGLLFIHFSTIGTATDSSPSTNKAVTISDVSVVKPVAYTELMDLTYLTSKSDISTYTMVINGTQTTIIQLQNETTAITLPDDRIGLLLADGSNMILPENSYFSSNQPSLTPSDRSSIEIPQERILLSVSNVLHFNVENISTNATYSQSIDTLNKYKTRIQLNDLTQTKTQQLITSTSVDWGDGTIEKYTPQDTTLTHVYQKSGSYQQTFSLTDSFGNQYTIIQNYKVNYEGDGLHAILWVKANPEPVAATSSVSLSIGTLGLVALTETGKYKLLALLPLLIPMYTRIQKEDVLDQFVRGQIYGYIKMNPGVHYNQIRRGMGIKNGTLSYHLSVLEKTELIKSRREGLKYRAFYPTGMKFPKKERFRLTELQIKIINVIKNYEGITQKDIAKQLGQKPQTINYNIKVLEQAELIQVVKRGRKTCIYPLPEQDPERPAQ